MGESLPIIMTRIADLPQSSLALIMGYAMHGSNTEEMSKLKTIGLRFRQAIENHPTLFNSGKVAVISGASDPEINGMYENVSDNPEKHGVTCLFEPHPEQNQVLGIADYIAALTPKPAGTTAWTKQIFLNKRNGFVLHVNSEKQMMWHPSGRVFPLNGPRTLRVRFIRNGDRIAKYVAKSVPNYEVKYGTSIPLERYNDVKNLDQHHIDISAVVYRNMRIKMMWRNHEDELV